MAFVKFLLQGEELRSAERRARLSTILVLAQWTNLRIKLICSVRRRDRTGVSLEKVLHSPDNQKVLEVVVDVLLLMSDKACQLEGEHEDLDGLLPFDA